MICLCFWDAPKYHIGHMWLMKTNASEQWITCCCCCCCCCYDKPVRQLPICGDKDVPKRWGIPPDSESGGICLSLVIVDSHFIDWSTTQGRLSLPTADVLSTIVKWSMLMDVDKLLSCSRFSDSIVGFTGQKTQPTASQYWRKYMNYTCTNASASNHNPNPRSRHNVLVGLMHWFALTQRSDAVFHHTTVSMSVWSVYSVLTGLSPV